MISAAELLYSTDWDSIAEILAKGKRFLLTTHVNADPDALGSELALAEVLRLMQKEPVILNPTPVSKNYLFMDPNSEIQVYENGDDIEFPHLDAVMILDISRWERLGSLADPIRHCGKPRICLDHHPYSGGFADYHLVNTDACATAEIVYDLLQKMDVSLNKRIAECLYTSMLADTGSFSFSNTSARCHRIAAELLSHNVAAREIFERLYQNHTPERLRFLGKALSDLRFDCGNKLAWMSINHQTLRENCMCVDDLEGYVEMPRNCRTVLLSILFLEVEPEDIKISLRAKGDFNANALAALFGGGGHAHASGIRMKGKLELVQQAVLSEARRALEPFHD
jgi:phosphoesterase RecJ-like protein